MPGLTSGTRPGRVSASRNESERMAQIEKREVKIVSPDYQPNKAELEADMRVSASFDEAIEALCQPVSISYIEKPRRNGGVA